MIRVLPLLLLACARPVQPVPLAEPIPAAVEAALVRSPHVGLYRLVYLGAPHCGEAAQRGQALTEVALTRHGPGWGDPPLRVASIPGHPWSPSFGPVRVAGGAEAMPPGVVRDSIWIVAAVQPTRRSRCHDGAIVPAIGHPDGLLWEVFRSQEAARSRLEDLRALR